MINPLKNNEGRNKTELISKKGLFQTFFNSYSFTIRFVNVPLLLLILKMRKKDGKNLKTQKNKYIFVLYEV